MHSCTQLFISQKCSQKIKLKKLTKPNTYTSLQFSLVLKEKALLTCQYRYNQKALALILHRYEQIAFTNLSFNNYWYNYWYNLAEALSENSAQ